MSVQRSALTRGPAYVTYNSHTFEVRDKITVQCVPVWDRVLTSMFGPVGVVKKDNLYRILLRLWGAWENLSDIFPSYLTTPAPGASVFGTSDKPLGIQARNNDLITFANAAVTRMPNLYLGVDSDLFAADLEFTCLIKNNANPEDSGSYRAITAPTYSAATEAFAKTNFKRRRFTAAWGAITGFTALVPQKGIQISTDAQLKPVPCDGLGTVDYSVESMIAQAKLIGIQPTLAQVLTNSQEETAHGTPGETISGDLVCTGTNSGPVITLKNSYLKASNTEFSAEDLRVGELTFENTTAFSAGAAAAAMVVA